jgi:hypothetical protein
MATCALSSVSDEISHDGSHQRRLFPCGIRQKDDEVMHHHASPVSNVLFLPSFPRPWSSEHQNCQPHPSALVVSNSYRGTSYILASFANPSCEKIPSASSSVTSS